MKRKSGTILPTGFGGPWEIAETRRRHGTEAGPAFDDPNLDAFETAVEAARRAFGIEAASFDPGSMAP
jgi:hypothetical protein